VSDCALPPFTPIIAYLRVSGDVQKEHGTIVGQLDALERYVAKHKLTLIRPPFTDEAKPGSSASPRDGFQAMIAFTHQEPRPCDAVIFWSWSRFARDQDDAHFYKADLRRRGYTLISLSDGIPPHIGIHYVMEALIHWKDEEYLKQLSLQTKRGLHLLARHGYAPGGFPPRGYLAEHIEVDVGGTNRQVARWKPDPLWADTVRKAWELRADGASYSEILQQTGLYNSVNSLTTHFRNKTYLGYRRCGEVEVARAHEPLIDQELWDRVQQTLYERPTHGHGWPSVPHPRQRSSPHLLTGLLRCAYCDAAIIGRTCNTGRHRQWRFYECGTVNRQGPGSCPNKRISATRLEKAVLDAVFSTLLRPDSLAATLEEVNRSLAQAEPTGERERLESRIRTLNRGISNLLDLAETSPASEDLPIRLRQREQERETLQRQLLLLGVEQPPLEISEDVFEELLADLRDAVTDGDLPERQALLRSVLDRVVLEDRTAYLHYQSLCAAVYQVPPGGESHFWHG